MMTWSWISCERRQDIMAWDWNWKVQWGIIWGGGGCSENNSQVGKGFMDAKNFLSNGMYQGSTNKKATAALSSPPLPHPIPLLTVLLSLPCYSYLPTRINRCWSQHDCAVTFPNRGEEVLVSISSRMCLAEAAVAVTEIMIWSGVPAPVSVRHDLPVFLAHSWHSGTLSWHIILVVVGSFHLGISPLWISGVNAHALLDWIGRSNILLVEA